mgnify:CR=1 FL=1
MAVPICGIVFLITGHAGPSVFAGAVVPAFAFLFWLILKDIWDDSKAEVEYENRDMMYTLRGDPND